MKGTPPNSVGAVSDSGWTDSEIFITWLKHFHEWTHSSKANPQLLVLDGHHSHKTLEAILFAREHGIHLLTLQPHTSHKMQPLDRTFFKALKANYNTAADNLMRSNPGKRVTMFDVGELFGLAYNRVATPEKAIKGFEVTGLWPLNELFF